VQSTTFEQVDKHNCSDMNMKEAFENVNTWSIMGA